MYAFTIWLEVVKVYIFSWLHFNPIPDVLVQKLYTPMYLLLWRGQPCPRSPDFLFYENFSKTNLSVKILHSKMKVGTKIVPTQQFSNSTEIVLVDNHETVASRWWKECSFIYRHIILNQWPIIRQNEKISPVAHSEHNMVIFGFII